MGPEFSMVKLRFGTVISADRQGPLDSTACFQGQFFFAKLFYDALLRVSTRPCDGSRSLADVAIPATR
jgi:hypothetical protein